MCWWYGNASWPLWAWWWVVPLVGIALCIMMCMFFKSRMGNRRFCCWGGVHSADLEEMKKEIRRMSMDEQTKKLIAVGANCHPCLEYHVGKALEAGINRDEIMEAVDVAKAVRRGAASSMDKLAMTLIQDRLPSTSGVNEACSCCS